MIFSVGLDDRSEGRVASNGDARSGELGLSELQSVSVAEYYTPGNLARTLARHRQWVDDDLIAL